VLLNDSSHAGSYRWCGVANKAIGQVVNYLQQMEINQLQLKERINQEYQENYGISFNIIKPRVYILIGNSANWPPQKKKAFRTLNYSLHGIEIITYNELAQRGESILSMFRNRAVDE
jgi:hypothetical protein